MSFDQEGYRVLSSITGVSHKDRWIISEYARLEKSDVYVTFDNDDAGYKFFKNIAEFLLSRKILNFKRLNLPAKYKDISEFYAAGSSLDELIEKCHKRC